MSSRLLACALMVAFSPLAACHKQGGTVAADGYTHADYPYGVRASQGVLMGSDWQLDNFHEVRGEQVAKGGERYESRVSFDADGDGDFDADKEWGYRPAVVSPKAAKVAAPASEPSGTPGD